MKIPSFLYGTYKDVKARCRPLLTNLKKGASLSSLAGDMLDTDITPGLVVIDGPSPLVGSKTCFHCFTPIRLMIEAKPKLDEKTESSIVSMCLENDWSFLGLMSQGGLFIVMNKEWHLPFARAFAHHWSSLSSVGPRYSRGSDEGKYLWEIPATIWYVLANQGIESHEFRRPLNEELVNAFLRRIEERHACA